MMRRRMFMAAHHPWVGGVLRWIIRHMDFLIPLERLRETDSLIAFYHPRPLHRVHILIVPKRAYPSLMMLDPLDSAFLRDVYETVQSLVRSLNLEPLGYRLIVNGGTYQETPVLHYHLIADGPES